MNVKTIILAAVAVLGAAGAATAEDGVWQVGNTWVVRHADLDLQTQEGRRQLLDMVETAARRACRNEASRTERLACQVDAIEQALAATNPGTRTAVGRARLERQERTFAQR